LLAFQDAFAGFSPVLVEKLQIISVAETSDAIGAEPIIVKHAAKNIDAPRKMACRARSRGGRLERSKAIDSRHGVARLLPLNFLRLRRAPEEKAPPQRG
jgi:hypothetical protein